MGEALAIPRLLATLGLTLSPFLLVALYGFFRLRRMRDVLDPDWRLLAEFGAALRAYSLSAVHDAAALDALRALAPDVEPLLLRPGPGPLSSEIEALPRARDEAPLHPAPGAGERALADLGRRVIEAERLLQAEMLRLGRSEASYLAWLTAGVAGLLLAVLGSLGDARTSARTRRRRLEASPRFRDAVLVVVLVAVFAAAGGVVLAVVRWLRQAGMLHRPA